MLIIIFIIACFIIIGIVAGIKTPNNNLGSNNGAPASNTNPQIQKRMSQKDLSDDFMLKNLQRIRPLEKKLCVNAEDLSVDAQIAAYKNALSAFDELKNFCYQTDGGKIYFQDMWEHCHNSKEECFSFESKLKERLEYLQNNRDDLIYVQTHKSTLRSELKEYLSSHEGVVQKDIYKDFNPLLKSVIQHELYLMDKEGVIKRGKKGSSYLVELIN